ncbi:HD-GYP domain-containing protein [Imhoffiella purpurea]|uniref:HD-GYP domain-containing protein n=1 Tax=Imhoffiella purpurea TaxID=1249627 RepID=UPI0005C1C4B8|nr:DUF3391 domain-containing protein [Imhoffiella purpurea]
MSKTFLETSQLRIGLFVHLDMPWMDHPFLTSSFKIRTQKQLDALRQLRLAKIRIDPGRSDPPAAGSSPAKDAEAVAEEPPLIEEMREHLAEALWEEKRQRIEALKQRRSRLNQCSKRYTKSVGSARKLMSQLRSSPMQAVEAASDLVTQMVDDLTADCEATVQLVNLKHQDENSYYHCVNVAALAMVIGQQLSLDKSQLRLLGMGALFHDLGHQKIPTQILLKKEAFNSPERKFYEQHPRYGVEIARNLSALPKPVVEIIARHHEHLDGSGFPEGVKGGDIGMLTRIVTVVNRYDNLCNGFGADRGMSPHQAISHMYTSERQCYDAKVLTTFITNLGVYPPGTVVQLSDERVALVVTINPQDLLKPNVLVYSPEIPQEEALILDLAEEEVGIRESLHRTDLTQDQIEYLNLSDKLSYYFQSSGRR